MSAPSTFNVHGKIILFGEWAVLKGAPALSIPVSAECTIAITYDKSLRGIELSSAADRSHWTKWDDKADPYFNFVEAAIRHYAGNEKGFAALSGQRLSFHRHWRIEEGLGSSSAVLLLTALWCLHRLELPRPKPHELWKTLHPILQSAQGGRGSGLDLATQIFDSPILFRERGTIIEKYSINVPPEVIFIHAGMKADTSELLKSRPELAADFVNKVGGAVEDFINDNDWQKCMRRHHAELKTLGVVPPAILKLEELWKSQGLITELKTCGAGGGDTLMVWVKGDRRDEFIQSLPQVDCWHSHYDPILAMS
jgi:mevalonate kinase